ncbi:MAG: dihydrofolate reductase family protein [Actinomycetota bacterium]
MTELDVSLQPLFEVAGATPLELPEALETAYGGPFWLPERIVYGNFVTSVDGIAALPGVTMSSAVISGGAPPDRFVMALLRGTADAVVVGAGTLREHGGPWTAERAFPAGAELFRRARAAIASTDAPTLVVVTSSGELPRDHPALETAIVATTSSGARTIEDRQIRTAAIIDVGDADGVDVRLAIEELRDRGFRRILAEGGPTLMGSMLEAGAVDQLFLTISPTLIGGGSGRPPLTDAADLLDSGQGMRLLSIRRAEDYLFLRYELTVKGTR